MDKVWFTRKEAQEEQSDTSYLFLNLALRVLFHVQFIHDCYLHILRLVIKRSISMSG